MKLFSVSKRTPSQNQPPLKLFSSVEELIGAVQCILVVVGFFFTFRVLWSCRTNFRHICVFLLHRHLSFMQGLFSQLWMPRVFFPSNYDVHLRNSTTGDCTNWVFVAYKAEESDKQISTFLKLNGFKLTTLTRHPTEMQRFLQLCRGVIFCLFSGSYFYLW